MNEHTRVINLSAIHGRTTVVIGMVRGVMHSPPTRLRMSSAAITKRHGVAYVTTENVRSVSMILAAEAVDAPYSKMITTGIVSMLTERFTDLSR